MAIFKKLFLGDTVATSGNKCFRKLTTRNITFTIGGTQFEAEPNMTWGEWLESAYNTSGYYTKTITSGGVEYNPIIIAENGDAFTVVEIKGGVMEIGNGISANSEYLLVTLTQDSESIVGTWVLNEQPVIDVNKFYNIDFEVNGIAGTSFATRILGSEKYVNLTFSSGGDITYYAKYDTTTFGVEQAFIRFYRGTTSYVNKTTTDGIALRTITITGGADINNETFIAWLKANATKIS